MTLQYNPPIIEKVICKSTKQPQYDEVIQLHTEGLSYRKIAKTIGVNYSIIGYWIKFGMEQGTQKFTKYRKEYQEEYRDANKIEILKQQKEYRQFLHIEVLSHYSSTLSCTICGNTDIRVLDLHHKDNSGAEDRRKFSGVTSFYLSLKRCGFPEGYEVLCHNCNWSKELERRGHRDSPQAKSEHKLKLEVLSRYSQGTPKCSRCGDEILTHLTMDHKDGGGRKHLKELGGAFGFHRYLRRNGYLPIAQILCWNCQRIKRAENSECSDPIPSTMKYPIGIQERTYGGRQCKSKYRGVTKKGNRYLAHTTINGKYLNLGWFGTPELAKQRIEDVKNHGWTPNIQNRSRNGKRFSSQFMGVYKSRNRWRSRVWVDGKNIYLGVFSTEKEAAESYDEKARELGKKTNFSNDASRIIGSSRECQ